MRVTLPSPLAELVKQKVEAGLYRSSQEVLAQALHLLDERDKKLASLQRDIQEGLNSGPGRPFVEKVVAEIKQRGREGLTQHNNAH